MSNRKLVARMSRLNLESCWNGAEGSLSSKLDSSCFIIRNFIIPQMIFSKRRIKKSIREDLFKRRFLNTKDLSNSQMIWERNTSKLASTGQESSIWKKILWDSKLFQVQVKSWTLRQRVRRRKCLGLLLLRSRSLERRRRTLPRRVSRFSREWRKQ